MQRGDHIKLNFEIFEMQKWNIPTDKTQRVDEKNGVICFTRRVIVIRMSKMTPFFCIFCWWRQKISHSLGKIFKYIVHLKDLVKLFQKMLWIIGFSATISKMSTPLKIKDLGIFFTDSVVVFYISNLNISHER